MDLNIDNYSLDVDNTQQQNINYLQCMARKADNSQCTHTKKIGDYCKVHYDKQSIIRIDEPIVIKKKRQYTKRNICKNTILDISNNYNHITNNIYLRHIDKINKIQKVYRKYRIRKYNKLRGPALWNRQLCNNRDDIYTTEDINTITPINFFSILDHDNFIYGFHIETIYNYIRANSDKLEINNPYTNKPISNKIIEDIKKLFYFSKNQIGFTDITGKLPNNIEFKIRTRVLHIFQQMDSLNNYTDIDWFLKLSRSECLKLIHLIRDLWEYRMDLTPNTKMSIVKSGKIFNKTADMYKTLKINDLQNEILDEFEQLVFHGETRDDQYLGSLIILSGLVDISSKCAAAYPWLLQSSYYQ